MRRVSGYIDRHLFDEVAELGAALDASRARPDNGEGQIRNPLLFGQRREISSLEAVPKCLDNAIKEREMAMEISPLFQTAMAALYSLLFLEGKARLTM